MGIPRKLQRDGCEAISVSSVSREKGAAPVKRTASMRAPPCSTSAGYSSAVLARAAQPPDHRASSGQRHRALTGPAAASQPPAPLLIALPRPATQGPSQPPRVDGL